MFLSHTKLWLSAKSPPILFRGSYLEDGAELADDVHASHAEVLAERDLQEEERDAAREQGQEVGDQEGPWRESK